MEFTGLARLFAFIRGREWILLAVALALGWEAVGRVGHYLFLPPLSAVVRALVRMFADGTLPAVLAGSALTLAAGVAISVSCGLLIGAAMAQWHVVDEALRPFIDAMMSAPIIALIPVFIALFGVGYGTRLATVVVFSIFPVILNTYEGLRVVDPTLVDMGRSFGARGAELYRHIRLPAALPLIRAGFHLCMLRGVRGLVNGEVLISVVGIGGVLQTYGAAFAMPQLWAVIVTIVAFAFALLGIERLLIRLFMKGGGASMRDEAA
ncbi:MAG TPA: ABC transporter permease subunit [Casimicrobiaceae bacterium]|nr:ABC transporter permease subunit [Casimicrobiaceae bacterium]